MASTAETLVETQSNSPIKPKDEAMVPTEDAHQDMDTAETSLKDEGNSDVGGNTNDMGENSAGIDEVDGDISIKPDSVITKEMIEEEKNLHEQSEKEEKKIKDEQDKIWQHLDEEDREQRYKRLQFLLSKSNLYTQYLLNRMSKQQEDDQKKRERQAKRKQKEKLKAEQKLKEEQEAAATAATSEATSDTAPVSSDEKEAVDRPVAPVVENKTPLRVTRGRKSVKNGNDSQDSQSSQDSTKSTSSKRGRKRKNQPSDEENEGAADIKNYFKPVGKKQKLEDGSAMSAENGGSSCDTKTSNCDKTDDNKNEAASTGTINSKEENKENKNSENNAEEKINNNEVAKNTDGSNPEVVDGNSEAAKKMEEENLQDVDVNNEGSMVVQPVLFTGGKLRPYQGDGYTWLKMLYENGVNGILADEMGLGKTVQCIAMISHLVSMGVPGPFLICAPLSTLPNWCAEFRRFAPKVPIVLYHGNKDERPRLRMKMRRFHPVRKGLEVRPVVITSYEITMRDRKVMQNFEWKYLIVDEGHRIKNTECRLIRELRLYRNTHRLLLTGTPLQNNLTELWSLLNFLLPEIFDDLGSFEAWLDVEHITSEGADERIIAAEQQKNILSMLHQILTPFMLRRLKADVDLKIPPKKEILVYAPLSQLQQNFYQATVDKSILSVIEEKNYGKEEKEVDQKGRPVRRSCKKKVNYNLMVETEKDLVSPEKVKNKKKEEEELESWIQAMIDVQESSKPVSNKEEKVKKSQVTVKLQNVMMQLRKCCNHPYLLEYPLTESGDYKIDEEVIKSCGKMLLLDKMLKELKVRGHKVLLFSQMTKMLDIIEDFCYLRQYKYCRLDGSCSVEDRQESMSSFNTDPELFIFLLSTRAGGLGINLTGADTVIIYDSDWNPQSDLQAQDRCHRIGQTKPVVVYRYVTANTIDQRIVERAAAKRKLEKMIIHQGKFKSGMQNFNTSLKPLSPQELLDLLKSTDYRQSMKGEDGSVVSEEDLERLLDRSDLYDIWSKTSGTEKVNPRKKKSFKSKVKKEVDGVFRVIDEEGGEKMVLKSETDTSKPLTAE